MPRWNYNLTHAPVDGTTLWMANKEMQENEVQPYLCKWGEFISPMGKLETGWRTIKCGSMIKPDRWAYPKPPKLK